VGYRFLLLLGFNVVQSAAGVLALLFCTTHLHYTQNMMENNYILLLTMAGLRYQYQWLRTGERGALVIGAAAFGLNLLTRLTTGLDLLMGGLFLLLVLAFEREESSQVWLRAIEYVKFAVPIYAVFLLLDRLYQFYRFGEWTTTYVKYFSIERRLQDSSLPANYPWTTPFLKGFLGPLISPEKSIFLFDPLIVLSIVISVLGWKLFSPSVKAFLISTLLLISAYIGFYARYYEWSGNF